MCRDFPNIILVRRDSLGCQGILLSSTYSNVDVVVSVAMATKRQCTKCNGKQILAFTVATVPSRRYRRQQAYGYRQDLMYLSMVICICIFVFTIDDFEMPVPFRCEILA